MSTGNTNDTAATEGCAAAAGYVTGTESKCDACGGYGYREKLIFGKWRVVPCFACKGNDQFVSRSHTDEMRHGERKTSATTTDAL